jgi:hypothetical protein
MPSFERSRRRMGKAVMWTVRLEATDADGSVVETSEIASISRDLKKPTGADFGLKLSEGKAVLERLQTRITQRQVDDAAAMSRCCVECGSRRPIHDYQTRTTQTLFGKIAVRLPRSALQVSKWQTEIQHPLRSRLPSAGAHDAGARQCSSRTGRSAFIPRGSANSQPVPPRKRDEQPYRGPIMSWQSR